MFSFLSKIHSTSKYIRNIESGMKINMECVLCDVEYFLLKIYKYDVNAK